MRTFLLLAALAMTAPAADKRPMTFDDLMAFKRVADPQISPDGKQVVYQVTEISDVSQNKKHTHLWIADTDGKTPPRQLTSSGKADTHPRWSPDGSKILFESTRSGTQQLWLLDLKAGGEAKQLTTISTGASNGLWSPDGYFIAFVSAVYPEFSELPFDESDKKNKEKNDAIEANPVKAKTFTKLFYRHWDEYVGDKRQHIFALRVWDGFLPEESPTRPENRPVRNFTPKDLTPGDRDANPTSSTFSVGDDFTFTPDSRHIVFTAVPKKDQSWSTNHDLCRVAVMNLKPSTDWETLTKDNPAADNSPRFSPDGKRLAWRSQKKAGYEADAWRVMVVDCSANGDFKGTAEEYSNGFSCNEFCWLGDIIVMAGDMQGSVHIIGAKKGDQSLHFMSGGDGSASSLSAAHVELRKSENGEVIGEHLVYIQATMNRPPEVRGRSHSKVASISKANDTLFSSIDTNRPESVKVKIEGGEMQMWILKPPGFDEKKKWPIAYLIHGGPQGAWEDGWSYRWNPQLWAAQGYVVVMPNPRGSTGFGQKFVDEISGDWGGKCYRDLVAGLEYTKKLPYVDANRMASAGASFGGYMQDWFAVNEIAKEFKCLISHCSVYNFESMWGTTDELWFDEYEHGGLPWEIPGKYREFSPHTKAGNLGKYKTPMLLIQNDLDFRCPIGQGHELFSALQRQGVPSRFVNFPDECHWVLKPANSKHWHNEVFSWLKEHCPPGGK